MAALDVAMVLRLVDKASGPGQRIIDRIFGGANRAAKGPVDALNGTRFAAGMATGAIGELNRAMATFVAGAGAYVGVKSMIGGAVDLEAHMANVQKMVNGMSKPQLDILGNQIKQISRETPLAATELMDLVAGAAQFGIENKNLLRFAQLGAKSAVAFEMTATEASEGLSQMRNALGLTMDQLEEYADMINFVADANGSSEKQLVDFVLRTGAGARAAGLDPRDLLAIGSAMTEVGISSQRAGTSVNAMITKMTALGKKGVILDKVGGKGYSKKLQKEFYETPRKALVSMLKASKELSRPDRAEFFKDLFGLETQDEANALAGNIDKVVKTVEQLGDAANYAGSVQKTFDIFSKTTESQWKQFQNNVKLSSAAMGAYMLPAINDSLQYLNTFFATAEGRINIFDRLKDSFGGFVTGLGYKGGSAAFFDDITAGLKEVRDLIFGIEGDDAFGEGGGRIFERWRQFGEAMKNSPIATIFDSIGNAKLGDMGGALTAGALGMGALSIAAKIALAPVKAIVAVLRTAVRLAYTLSGLKLAKWLFDLASGGKAGVPAAAEVGAGAAGGWLARNAGKWMKGAGRFIGRGAGRAFGLPAFAAEVTARALMDKGPADQRFIEPNYTSWALRNAEDRAAGRETTPAPAPSEAVPFSFGQLWNDLMQPIPRAQDGASSGPQAVTMAGPVQTMPSGVQQVEVTNPQPAPTIYVTVNATTNASAAQIGEAVGNHVGAAMRAAYAGL